MAEIKLIEVSTTINGTYTDITDIVERGNFRVVPAQFAPKKAQSQMTGAIFGGLVKTNRQIIADCNQLTQAQTETILPLIANEYVYVNYRDPALGWREGIKFLSGNAPAAAMMISGGVLWWNGISFTLTEVQGT